MKTASDIAKYFLSLCDESEGDLISNLKLQKLVYYAQGFSLVLLNRPLFNEKIEAWKHGPVVPSLYQEYKSYGNGALPMQGMDTSIFDLDEQELLDEVYMVYGQFSAWRLREMTHEESPWGTSYEEGKNIEITHEKMREYFVNLIKD